ncbi:PAS-domain containing protein, partial [Sphingomonas sp.]|uniref:PAS-domain containing protein n=1 Tax=Sphingomonas sp. TaxID=28214 RepID=UPI0025D7D625
MWTAAILAIRSAEQAALGHARLEAGNLAASFADEVTHNLDLVAAGMDAIAQRMRAGGPFNINAWARDIPMLAWATIQVAIIGPDGRLISSTADPDAKPIDLSDREHVRVHLERRVAGLFIGKPVLGRVSHKVTIQITRRVEGSDGRLLGIVLFSLAPGDLTNLNRMIDMSPHGVIVLTGLDSVILARFSQGDLSGIEGIGQSVAGRPRPEGFPEGARGFYVKRGTVDPIERIFAYQRLARYPLVVTVGLDRDYVLAVAQDGAVLTVMITTAVTILMASIAAYLRREIRRRGEREAQQVAEQERLEAEVQRRYVAEQRSREAQELLQDAVDSLSEGLAIYDRDDQLVLSNAAMHRLFPQQAELMVPGRRFEDIMRGVAFSGLNLDAVGREDAWVAERVQAHREAAGSFEQRLSDGRCLLITNRRMRNGGIASLRVDVTRLKEIEAQRREAQEVLEDAVNSLSEGLAIYDREDRLVLANETMRRLYGRSNAVMEIGKSYEEIMREVAYAGHAADAIGREEEWILDQVKTHREPLPSGEERRIGQRRLILTNRRMRNGGIVSLRVEVTELKRTEARLREAQATLQDAVESIADAFVIYDADDCFVMCNEAYRQLYPT